MTAARRERLFLPSILNHRLTDLRGVGPKLEQKLRDYGIQSVEDLLFHLPLRYQDRTRVTPIGALQEGTDVVIEGEIRLADITFGRRRSLAVRIQDGTGTAGLRFFHFSAAQKAGLQPGRRLRCFGQVRRGPSGAELFHPEYQFLDVEPAPLSQSLTPVYPTTEGVSQTQWRKLCGQALTLLRNASPPDLLPGGGRHGPTLEEALMLLHQPPAGTALDALRDGSHPAQLRLALEELAAHHLSLLQLRELERFEPAPALRGVGAHVEEFLQRMPFTATAAQRRVLADIAADLARGHPMLRLVQGDVGSGKTLVAAAAAVAAIRCGFQVAVMAPTELLAEQHHHNFSNWLQGENCEIAFLSGRIKGRARSAALEAISSGTAALAIGTHALFQEQVSFARLALVIVDEQHRFGVHQRLALKEKAAAGSHPHQLVMTATPIPRTLSMVAYADLDCSVIDELPPGRTPVDTVLIEAGRRDQVMERIAAACQQGRQAYWVCTLVEESDVLEAQAAEQTFATLQERLPGLRVGLIHGRLKAEEKAAVMQAFKQGELDLLVATTVIEVGVDVPNASLMVIENPERLGLAQLHQLRGRVGRGTAASHCVLLYQSPLSRTGRARLQAMRDSSDGFFIAEKDLELRGPGEVLGTRQTGLMEFRVARLPEHNDLLEQVQDVARTLLEEDPDRARALVRRWTAGREAYAQV